MATYNLTPFASNTQQHTKIVESTAAAATSSHTFVIKEANRYRRMAITTIAAGLTNALGDLTSEGKTLNSAGTVIGTVTGIDDRYGTTIAEANKAIGNAVWEIVDSVYDEIHIIWTRDVGETTGTIKVVVTYIPE